MNAPTRFAVRSAGIARVAAILMRCVLAAPESRAVLADTVSEVETAIAEYRDALESPNRAERLAGFERAALLFAKVVRESPDANPTLLVNWGNASLQAGKLGDAVLAYRRALACDPNHRVARQNLAAARLQLPDWVPRPADEGIWQALFVWRRALSVPEQSALAAVCFVLACTLLAIAIRWQRPVVRLLAMLPLLVWGIVGISLVLELFAATSENAVVISDEVVARSADSIRAAARFSQPVPGGTEVTIEERSGDWSYIRFADGRQAWLPTSSLAAVETP